MKITLTLNGVEKSLESEPHLRLLDVLREEIRLTGTKEGCGEGECGACTVLIDGEPVNSCLVAVAQVHGRSVTTVEGLEVEGKLSPVQESLVRLGGTQCGICTPGIAVCATAVLRDEPKADRARVRELLAGNICRCTGYQLIVDAIRDAGDAK
jgi:carbon-monoxide dehydrogenase small subunit